MAIRIASMILRICGVLALILGILFWLNIAKGLTPIHMLLGIIVVLSLWVIGIGQALARGGSWGIAALAIIVGLALVIVGATQTDALYLTASTHWIIQVVHLLLALIAIGVGEMGAGRYRRSAASVAAS